jgi:hypothetical protein
LCPSEQLRDGQVLGGGSNLELIMEDGKRLVQFIIPESSVGYFAHGRDASKLLEVYRPSDHERVRHLNGIRTKGYTGAPWGGPNIDSGYERTDPTGYPAYQVAVDLNGTVHSARRIAKLKRGMLD